MLTSAASIPSAEVPDIMPRTRMVRPVMPDASRQLFLERRQQIQRLDRRQAIQVRAAERLEHRRVDGRESRLLRLRWRRSGAGRKLARQFFLGAFVPPQNLARRILGEEDKYDKASVDRVVGALTRWAASLGSQPARDLLAELEAGGILHSAAPLPPAKFTDLPPWW